MQNGSFIMNNLITQKNKKNNGNFYVLVSFIPMFSFIYRLKTFFLVHPLYHVRAQLYYLNNNIHISAAY